jgi:hypothetical protein
MNPDEFCTSDQWSMLTSASSNPQPAGVLGGFLITAIARTQGAVSTGMLAAGATAMTSVPTAFSRIWVAG